MRPLDYATLMQTINGYYCHVFGHRFIVVWHAERKRTTPERKRCTRCGWEVLRDERPLVIRRRHDGPTQ